MSFMRYDRQIPLIGEDGQRALKNSTVFTAGAGGLGSPVLLYLAAAGIGRIRISDFDLVDESNLNRQILHFSSRVGMSKSKSAKKTIEALNSDCEVCAFSEKIDDSTIKKSVGDADVIVDCVDNFESRYVLNRFALENDIPLVHGAVSGFSGQVTTIIPKITPCLSCIFPNAVTEKSAPVLGWTAGVIGCIEAGEVIKLLTGAETLAGRLLIYDGKSNTIDTFSVKKNPHCKVCGDIERI